MATATPKHINRPPSTHSSDKKNTGVVGKEVQSDSKCTGTAGNTAGFGGKEEGSIRDEFGGYEGS